MALTVSVAINGHIIHTRTVVNRLAEIGYYVSDDGTFIDHDPDDGAVALAIKALRNVHGDPDVEAAKVYEIVGFLRAAGAPHAITGNDVRRIIAERIGPNPGYYTDQHIYAAMRYWGTHETREETK